MLMRILLTLLIAYDGPSIKPCTASKALTKAFIDRALLIISSTDVL
jgi:hypothetical protein